MKKSYIIMIVLSLIILYAGYFIIFNFNIFRSKDKNIYLIEEESSLVDFYIKGDKVHVNASLTIKSDYVGYKKFRLIAYTDEDYYFGLFLDKEIYITSKDGKEVYFEIFGPCSKEYDITFVGRHGKSDSKWDRNLPDIKIEIIE